MQLMKNVHFLISATYVSHPLHDLSHMHSHKVGKRGCFMLVVCLLVVVWFFLGKMDVAAFNLV